MTDITELAQILKAAAEKATQGEWWSGEVKNEGCYGSGDDCVEGFTSYAIYGSDGQTLFDSLNSDAACISEEYDGEGHVAWDETAQRNAEFIALANPVNVLALVEDLEKAQQRNAELEAQNDYFASLVAMARVSADKAIRKFPQPNYVLLKVAEEAGEVVQAGVHYAENRMEWGKVEGEIVQLLAMLIRLVTEGDQVNGITPPASCYAGIKVEAE
ncbi:ead/Ea22-like family protein [Klebsiella variicola]|uniref:ead/Ea22-like family protein n=1 Tax=Klebsiella variicola TaxID=244366 RepID=UPI00143D1B0D|nr:ead/Ea22-like family protein [Klebsiella variicola]